VSQDAGNAGRTGPYRYAVYYVPDQDSDLYRLGSSLLGYSLREGKELPMAALPGAGAPGEYSKKASVYGFHSTVIAPFRTQRGKEGIASAIALALSKHAPFRLAPLRLRLLNGFPALCAEGPMDGFQALEKSLLEALYPLFLPPDPESLGRRGELNPKQLGYFWKWGYPFVLDEHRFHMTLGDPNSSDGYIGALKNYFPASSTDALVFGKVTLCAQESPGSRFISLGDFPLGAAGEDLQAGTISRRPHFMPNPDAPSKASALGKTQSPRMPEADDQGQRQRRMRLLSLADPALLEDRLKTLEGQRDLPDIVFLKAASSGMIMVQGRMNGTGQAFNLGEMLISRSVVEVDGHIGYGFTPFENTRHAELAAILDALSGHPGYRDDVGPILEELASLREGEVMRDAMETEGTKVDFFTVKRGEDDE
jgi:alpha-D-ribose 1-methylphosphonate 5-triphosphate synthase subunit PhnG